MSWENAAAEQPKAEQITAQSRGSIRTFIVKCCLHCIDGGTINLTGPTKSAPHYANSIFLL